MLVLVDLSNLNIVRHNLTIAIAAIIDRINTAHEKQTDTGAHQFMLPQPYCMVECGRRSQRE